MISAHHLVFTVSPKHPGRRPAFESRHARRRASWGCGPGSGKIVCCRERQRWKVPAKGCGCRARGRRPPEPILQSPRGLAAGRSTPAGSPPRPRAGVTDGLLPRSPGA
jgi:hypothetical protein